VAESFGGPLAIQRAAHGSHNITQIILISSFARTPRPLAVFFAQAINLLPIQSAWMQRILSPLMFGRWANPALRQALHKSLCALHPADCASEILKACLTARKS